MAMLRPFDLKKVDLVDYFFIAHLFDRILIGKEGMSVHDILIEAINQDSILEVHFFNEEKEIYAARIDDKLVVYDTLMHQKELKKSTQSSSSSDSESELEEDVIIRSYLLDKEVKDQKGTVIYDILQVKEYINYDEGCQAYIDKTVLYRLKKDGE